MPKLPAALKNLFQGSKGKAASRHDRSPATGDVSMSSLTGGDCDHPHSPLSVVEEISRVPAHSQSALQAATSGVGRQESRTSGYETMTSSVESVMSRAPQQPQRVSDPSAGVPRVPVVEGPETPRDPRLTPKSRTTIVAQKRPAVSVPHTAPVMSGADYRGDASQSRDIYVRSGGASQQETVVAGARTDLDDEDQELVPDSALETPIAALLKSRKRLCLMLNIEQPLLDDYTADYMGLAEMLGFETLEIQNFWEQNPTYTLMMEWGRCQDTRLLRPVLRTLVDCLERLGRRDILQDCRGLILEDVSDYIAAEQLKRHYSVGRLSKFDCYVNIADPDMLTIGREIMDALEGVYGLRLCLTLRDVTLGEFEYEEMATMLELRCDSKVLIVLSKNYEDSEACQFLTQFAVTLDPGSRKNKLIPLLVDEDTNIPRVLRALAMLNFHRDRRLGFLWPRLRNAIKN